MPGFVTHYLFGEEIYHQLKCNSQKKNLFYNRSAYAFGLQGPPDLFFYYLPSYALHRHNLGALAHTTEPRAFFRGLLESYGRLSSAADRGIAEAYISGFLGHYLLDTTCHPYIYAMTHYHDKKEKSYFPDMPISRQRSTPNCLPESATRHPVNSTPPIRSS